MARPIGRKNNATLLKEAEQKKALKLCEGTAALAAPKVIEAMVKKAIEGDVSAAKLILDRVYPAMRQVEDRPDGNRQVIINITGDAQIGAGNADEHSRKGAADQREPVAADGEITPEALSGEILAFDGGAKG